MLEALKEFRIQRLKSVQEIDLDRTGPDRIRQANPRVFPDDRFRAQLPRLGIRHDAEDGPETSLGQESRTGAPHQPCNCRRFGARDPA